LISCSLDILVNNAGIINADSIKTEDGLLPLMAANYLGPFLLTNLLLGLFIPLSFTLY